jgi:hypothetical protein
MDVRSTGFRAEADSCPPEKVLGRKLARLYWRTDGRSKEVKLVMVAAHGTRGIDRWTVITMYYPYGQLTAPWIGDREIAPIGLGRNDQK